VRTPDKLQERLQARDAGRFVQIHTVEMHNRRQNKSVSFLPVQLDGVTNDPEILTADDPRFHEVAKYMEEITVDQKIAPHFTIDGDEIRII
jgi:hypothetical protein